MRIEIVSQIKNLEVFKGAVDNAMSFKKQPAKLLVSVTSETKIAVPYWSLSDILPVQGPIPVPGIHVNEGILLRVVLTHARLPL